MLADERLARATQSATIFALTERGFDPTQHHPNQELGIRNAIESFIKTGKHERNIAPVAELGLLAFCRKTGIKPPRSLGWDWNDLDTQNKLVALVPA